MLARAALQAEGSNAGEPTEEIIRELEEDIRPDGSVGGAALPTIWRVHELVDLGRDGTDPAVAGLMRWVIALQEKPGAFGEGCDKERHAQRACEHYVAGFFAPGPPEQRLAPVSLPNGKVFRAEPAARFALSCLALRAALRTTSGDRHALDRHLRSLEGMASAWTGWSGFFAPDSITAAMHVLALAGPLYRATVARLVALVAEHQEPSGAWPNADLFHTLEGLLAAGTPEAREAVRRAVPALLERQRADGSFGATAQRERALIGLRALLWSEAER